jgi:hypothetical protein
MFCLIRGHRRRKEAIVDDDDNQGSRITNQSIALDTGVVPVEPRTTLVSERPVRLVTGDVELEGDEEEVGVVGFGVCCGDCDLVAAEGAEPV